MSTHLELTEQISYIKRVMEYSSKDYSRIYQVYFKWSAVFIFLYLCQILLRTFVVKNFNITSNIFYGNHRVIGLGVSIICILISTMIYIKTKKSSKYGYSSIARVLLNMWFISSLILIFNDTTNYIPFAFKYEVSIIYETAQQLIFSMIVLVLISMFTYYITHAKRFLYLALINIFFGIISIILSLILLAENIDLTLVLDFSEFLCIFSYTTMAILLKNTDKLHRA